MGKKLFSLCMALALCLGLLPVTALAAGRDAPVTLCVGETDITTGGYWKTTADGKLESGSESDYNVYYDGNGTLTLKDATIQGRGIISEGKPIDYGIYAASTSGQSVDLTINLIGRNTVKGYCGIYVGASGGDSTLVIQSDTNGSLETSGSGWNGIGLLSDSGNVFLTINKASVEASTEKAGYYGVSVKSNAGSPTISLTVSGGSLTAQGDSGLSGIRYFFQTNASNPSISLTVQNNALVKAMPGIDTAQSMASKPTPQGNGIVFDGTKGTVYGNVTLQDDLTIDQGETLTIPEGSTLNSNGNLTNNGTIVNKGTLNGDLTGGTGTVVNAPAITTDSLPEGTVNQPYTATLTATGNNITWSVSGTLPAGLTLDTKTGTISGTPTTANTYSFTVTATNASGSDSKEYTIQIAAKSDTTPPTLTAGTVNRSSDKDATVTFNSNEAGTYFYNVVDSGASEPTDITSGTSYNLNSDTNTITLTDLTAGAKDIYIVAKDAAGNQSATLKIEIPTYVEPVYSISADTELDFGSVYTGYAQPAAQTVTITNNGNQPLTLTQPASTSSFVVGTLSTASLPVNGTATFTVQPKAGLAVGTYSENITVSDAGGATVTITANFTVKQYSSGGSSTQTKTPSQQAIDKIEDAKEGSTVKITLRTGQTKLDKEVFEELAGRDVTLEISLPGGVTWTVNGEDIPKTADLTDLDMGVSLNTSTIPVDLINAITGEIGTVQLTLKHDGPFGFTMTLTAPVGKENKGLWANLYHYDEDAGEMVYQTAALVDEDGNAALPFDHASQYALVLDSKSHDLPFTDLAANAWYTDAVAYVYRHDIMEGMSATTFQPNGTLSRAMAVQIFYNLEGQPDISDENLGYPYEDVNAQAWYGNAVYWARITGVATGYGDGTFQPGDSITRQEFAQMLYNYAKYKGYDLTAAGDLSQFPDSGSVADWAEAAMSWANGNELINGHDDGTIDAGGAGTRAQAASILMRFDENVTE